MRKKHGTENVSLNRSLSGFVTCLLVRRKYGDGNVPVRCSVYRFVTCLQVRREYRVENAPLNCPISGSAVRSVGVVLSMLLCVAEPRVQWSDIWSILSVQHHVGRIRAGGSLCLSVFLSLSVSLSLSFFLSLCN